MKEYNVHIPRGCSCELHQQVGEHNNTIEVPTPDHMLSIGNVGCYEFRPTLCIDRCMFAAISALWERKVITTGCCCGHNQVNGYIGIYEP